MSVKERLKEFIKYKGISERKFCKAAGLALSYVNNIRVSIQPDRVNSIAVAFPELNTGWLLTGEGEMLKKNDTTNEYQTLNSELLTFLKEENKKCHKVVEDQMEIMKGMQKTIDILQTQLCEKIEASVAPEAGASMCQCRVIRFNEKTFIY